MHMEDKQEYKKSTTYKTENNLIIQDIKAIDFLSYDSALHT